MNSELIVESKNLTADQVMESNLALCIADVLVGIEHGLKSSKETVSDQGRSNRSIVVGQAEPNDGLNDGKQILHAVM